jgi:tetratricopeptide (TPR) repeat protein
MSSAYGIETSFCANRQARRAEQKRKKQLRTPFRANASTFPSGALPKLNEAADFYAAGRLQEAEACYRQALEADPDCAFAYYGLGRVVGRAGQSRAAYNCYKRALALDDTKTEY